MGNCISNRIITNRLQKSTLKNTPKLIWKKQQLCKVISVYDGDTIDIAIPLPEIFKSKQFLQRKVRLYGIDTPEIRTTNQDEKKAGYFARDKLKEKIENKIVKIDILEKPDKYGRLLGTIYYNNENINEWMVKENLAIQYFGGKKEIYNTNDKK